MHCHFVFLLIDVCKITHYV
uniref:Uncharacterized protein n=1 Tax=Arundo donax TaxID=35708 RepID=A0A0A9A9Q3_ARUDO